MLLNNVRDGLLAGFEFSIIVDSAWKWSEITVAAETEENNDRTGYFRVYETVNPTKLAFQGSTFGYSHIPEQDATIHPENSGLLQQDSSISQQLARDGWALRALIDDCTANHPECKQQSMLLHVSGKSTSTTVRLVKVSELEAVPIRYVCLSYCWGGLQPNMTTTSRLNSYRAGINTTEIPQTILDAICVTISMGYQYMWVDSFCIVQDSGPDKITELGQMGSIYSGAACTICVMSANSATEGFLQHTYPDDSEDQSIRTWHAGIYEVSSQEADAILERRCDFSSHNMLESPILERGWTFQEALLSPRLVMFFPYGQRPALRCSKYTVQTDGGKPVVHPKPLVPSDPQGTRASD
ncbi:uncharacterized protein N7484_008014 [Penicillium longicatenatum]|uniref:uncharacterized protein n=1 Tax=Penicillium longicatenatum TaxID=1561947 RepID=UPI0025491B6E|nr:uncharacterized protein N7484_008014 [Penicillium longicatenatum]KAJ5640152.1 hypothetical protein N7484_008014 [Penicillium longicatenatum]